MLIFSDKSYFAAHQASSRGTSVAKPCHRRQIRSFYMSVKSMTSQNMKSNPAIFKSSIPYLSKKVVLNFRIYNVLVLVNKELLNKKIKKMKN